MKKRNLKSLRLNKKSISNLERFTSKGGRGSGSENRICYSEQYITACYWEPRCESVHPRACR
jgi:hypothetical protein